jgi:hypothetical protein
MKKEVADFKASILNMYREHLGILNAIPDDYDEDYEEDEPQESPAAESVHSEPEEDLPVYGTSSPSESFLEPTAAEQNQTDIYNQAFGTKPVPKKSENFSALNLGQNL